MKTSKILLDVIATRKSEAEKEWKTRVIVALEGEINFVMINGKHQLVIRPTKFKKFGTLEDVFDDEVKRNWLIQELCNSNYEVKFLKKNSKLVISW